MWITVQKCVDVTVVYVKLVVAGLSFWQLPPCCFTSVWCMDVMIWQSKLMHSALCLKHCSINLNCLYIQQTMEAECQKIHLHCIFFCIILLLLHFNMSFCFYRILPQKAISTTSEFFLKDSWTVVALICTWSILINIIIGVYLDVNQRCTCHIWWRRCSVLFIIY